MQTPRILFLACCSLVCCAAPQARGEEEGPRVYAASSLTGVLREVARRYAQETGRASPRLVFGASSRLARQLAEGARAELVLTADEAWMDALEAQGLLLAGTRAVLLAGRLVCAVPRGASWAPAGPADLAAPPLRRLALAGPAVPAGRRAREALARHGLLERLRLRFVNAPSARAALALVERAEVDAGLLYATDAAASARVRVAFVFAADAHGPIRYPVALTRAARGDEDARAFYDYLRGEGAAEVFRAAGFALPGAPWPSAGSGRLPAGGSAVAPAASWAAPFARSLWVATASVALSLPWALGLGALLARREFFGKALLNTLLLSPLVLPPVVTGYLLLRLCGRNGPLGAFGLEVAFTRWGAVVAASVVGFPLLLLTVRSAFESVDPRYEQLAQTLGLHPLAAFARVTLPMALPGLVAGCVLAFARALGEFGATAVLAGDVPGETRTLALAVFALYEEPGGEEDARVLVWISLGLCLVALVGAERLTAAQRRRAREGEAA